MPLDMLRSFAPLRTTWVFCAFLLAGALFAEEKVSCLHAGPMPGYAEMNEASVWVQTSDPCRVQLRYWKSGEPRAARLSDVVETNAAADHIATFRLTGLQFGTEYEYELYLAGERVDLPFATKLKTRPMIEGRADLPAIRVVTGSCFYVDDPLYDRETHAGGFEIFDAMAKMRPDLMLWLGDNVYFRGADWTSEANMRARYRRDRAIPSVQPLLAATRHYAIWDDHDFGPNDSDGTFGGKEPRPRSSGTIG
jgi:alkaline phosphatase D